MGKIINYFQEVRIEMSKVTWPKKQEVARLTLTVFLFSGIIAVYLGLLDFGFTKMVEFLLSK